MRSYIIPFSLSVAVTCFTVIYSHEFCISIPAIGLNIKTIFEGFFNISAILTGFLMTIYCFIAVSSNPFIEKVQNTQTFGHIKHFMLTTTIITFLSSICSLILSAFDLKLDGESFGETFLISVWIFFSTLGIFFFLSCLHFFLILSDDVPKKPVTGG